MKKIARVIVSAFVISLMSLPVAAHEFWINPIKYQVPVGHKVKATFRNGEFFDGMPMRYFSRKTQRMVVMAPKGLITPSPRDGDETAFVTQSATPGLYVLGAETKESRLTYSEWAKWQKFIKHKDLEAVAAAHSARGLPQKGFREGYTRHAKSLVAVGDGRGADTRLGFETEIVAGANPYDAGYGGTMPVTVYYKSAPRADVQVEVFERDASGKVRVSLTRTDGQGVARIRTKPGHSYLIDSVVLREPERGGKKVVWETLWASLTFMHP